MAFGCGCWDVPNSHQARWELKRGRGKHACSPGFAGRARVPRQLSGISPRGRNHARDGVSGVDLVSPQLRPADLHLGLAPSCLGGVGWRPASSTDGLIAGRAGDGASRASRFTHCSGPRTLVRMSSPSNDRIAGATHWQPRLAREEDIPALEALIPISVHGLQAAHYSAAQMEAALGPVFGVDRQLIRDGTYFVVADQERILGCGGWSKRKSLYGGDGHRDQPDPELDPANDPARIRAFFVHPDCARRGIGRAILS